jgi:hypothetical protein
MAALGADLALDPEAAGSFDIDMGVLDPIAHKRGADGPHDPSLGSGGCHRQGGVLVVIRHCRRCRDLIVTSIFECAKVDDVFGGAFRFLFSDAFGWRLGRSDSGVAVRFVREGRGQPGHRSGLRQHPLRSLIGLGFLIVLVRNWRSSDHRPGICRFDHRWAWLYGLRSILRFSLLHRGPRDTLFEHRIGGGGLQRLFGVRLGEYCIGRVRRFGDRFVLVGDHFRFRVSVGGDLHCGGGLRLLGLWCQLLWLRSTDLGRRNLFFGHRGFDVGFSAAGSLTQRGDARRLLSNGWAGRIEGGRGGPGESLFDRFPKVWNSRSLGPLT